MDEKRKIDLCYHCDDKWFPGHACKKSKIYHLQEIESIEEEEIDKGIQDVILIEKESIPKPMGERERYQCMLFLVLSTKI